MAYIVLCNLMAGAFIKPLVDVVSKRGELYYEGEEKEHSLRKSKVRKRVHFSWIYHAYVSRELTSEHRRVKYTGLFDPNDPKQHGSMAAAQPGACPNQINLRKLNQHPLIYWEFNSEKCCVFDNQKLSNAKATQLNFIRCYSGDTNLTTNTATWSSCSEALIHVYLHPVLPGASKNAMSTPKLGLEDFEKLVEKLDFRLRDVQDEQDEKEMLVFNYKISK